MLRPYQQQAVDEIRSCFARGIKKILLQAPTGSGKTVIFSYILKRLHEKSACGLVVVRSRKLVEQASKRLDREGVPHGVIMAGHWRNRPKEKIFVCSIDTLYARRNKIKLPETSICIIDECHMAGSESYRWLVDQYPDAYWLGVTATPWTKNGLQHIASQIVRPITIKELIAQNFLVPPIYYAPSILDLTGITISKSTGDYAIQELDAFLQKNHPVGDIVSSWTQYGENRPTLLFAATVRHSKAIAESFNAEGIPALHIDADKKDRERDAAIKKLECGEIKVITNVGIFCTGVDIPSVSCIVMARPTVSYSLYIQQAGRGTRIYPGKKDFILIDNAGNVLRHGLITEEREGSLIPIQKGFHAAPSNVARCEECYAVFSNGLNKCPECGHVNQNSPTNRKEEKMKNPVDASLTPADEFHLKVISRRGELKDIAKRRAYKLGWIFFKLKEEFGEEIANKYMPKRKVPDWVIRKSSKIGQ